jgi:hypothetical protein
MTNKEVGKKATRVSQQLRDYAVGSYHDSEGAAAGLAYLNSAKMIEQEFNLPSSPDKSLRKRLEKRIAP